MHGALVKVVRSRCVSRVGVEGIVVRDSRYVFEVVTRGDGVKRVPKEHTVFGVVVPLEEGKGGDGEGDKEGGGEGRRPLVFEINGEMFQTRAPDRANRKFRMHFQKDL